MGGSIPLGYINQNKKLVIVPDEAERVRWIFRTYLELKSTGQLLEAMRRRHFETKAPAPADAKARSGGHFGKGALAYLLKNRCYVGEIVHKGQIYAGDHEAIVDREAFEAVQQVLSANSIARQAQTKGSPYLLTGLLFDSAGHRMSPSHTNKKGVRYRYYVSQARLQGRTAEAGYVSRVPAPDIEALIQTFVEERYGPLKADDMRSAIETHISKITVQAKAVGIDLHADDEAAKQEDRQSVSLPWSHKPFVVPKGITLEPSASPRDAPKARDAALTAIAKARGWVRELVAGSALTDIARRESRGERQIRLLIPLAFLSPQTVQAVAEWRWKPISVTELARTVPLAWPNQA